MTPPAPDVVLALDTSGAVGSVAVAVGGLVAATESLAVQREHASRLIPAIESALASASLSVGALGGVVVGEGPGSFTGVRIGAATAIGMARALDVPLWAVSSLAAAALAQPGPPVRYVLFDARAERVYGACYGVGAAIVDELVAPHGGDLRTVLAGDVPPGAVFMGEGAERHRGVIEGAGFEVVPGGSDGLAIGALEVWSRAPDATRVDPTGGWQPAYLRDTSAVTS